MTNDELIQLFIPLIGRNIRVNSSRRQEDTFTVLASVVQTSNGTVWLHSDNGIAALVEPDDFTLEVEEVSGSHDDADAQTIADVVRRIKFVYGDNQAERNQYCNCLFCTDRRAEREAQKQFRLAALLPEPAPEIESAPSVPDSTQTLGPKPGYFAPPPPSLDEPPASEFSDF